MRELIFSAAKKDFRIDWFSGTGAGGQHRNKHQNCCRITHIATGLVGQCQEHRERPANQKKAFHRLVDKLVAHYCSEEARERYASGKETIRTYHGADNRVKDNASGLVRSYTEIVEKLNLAPMIEARHRALLAASP